MKKRRAYVETGRLPAQTCEQSHIHSGRINTETVPNGQTLKGEEITGAKFCVGLRILHRAVRHVRKDRKRGEK